MNSRSIKTPQFPFPMHSIQKITKKCVYELIEKGRESKTAAERLKTRALCWTQLLRDFGSPCKFVHVSVQACKFQYVFFRLASVRPRFLRRLEDLAWKLTDKNGFSSHLEAQDVVICFWHGLFAFYSCRRWQKAFSLIVQCTAYRSEQM